MIYLDDYDSVLGRMTIAVTDDCLAGVWFDGQKHDRHRIREYETARQKTSLSKMTKEWLDSYFAGGRPHMDLPLQPPGTFFQQTVWQCLMSIPYGEVITYGKLRDKVCQQLHVTSMAAQAVGSAVGYNPISVIVPCHRVIASDGSLRGYAGGLERKRWLLRHECNGNPCL